MRVACIQGDANRFHYRCACRKYGTPNIVSAVSIQKIHTPHEIVQKYLDRVPLDREGNPLWVIFEEDWREEKRKARAHGESIYDSCGVCLGRIR